MKTTLRSHHHSVYKMTFHLVLVTKYRHKCLTKEMLTRLEEICKTQCEHWDMQLLEFGGEADHVHLLIDMQPSVAPSTFIGSLKTVTSRAMRKEFAEHLKPYYWKPVFWSRSYCLLSTGGANIDTIKQYIQKQQSPEN